MLGIDHIAAAAHCLMLGDAPAGIDFRGGRVTPGVQQQGRRVDRRGGFTDGYLDQFESASRVTPRDTRPASEAQATSSARPPSATHTVGSEYGSR